jgi:DNA-binding transcriptional ArsR family regulator
MTTLQELITRGRFVMADAPSRVEVFEAVDGRNTARDIASRTGRHINNVRRDMTVLRDAGLIQPKQVGGEAIFRDGLPIYEVVPLARTISVKYFKPVAKRPERVEVPNREPRRRRQSAELAVPDENEILAIARHGEDQLYEFKAPGTEMNKIAREIGAMLNTSQGGMIFYGIEDDGTIVGTDMTRQKFDQPLQNSIKNTIAPAATVGLHAVSVLGSEVLTIIVPPWNRSDVYQHGDRISIRKGTNVFAAKPEEVRQLHRGEAVV